MSMNKIAFALIGVAGLVAAPAQAETRFAKVCIERNHRQHDVQLAVWRCKRGGR